MQDFYGGQQQNYGRLFNKNYEEKKKRLQNDSSNTLKEIYCLPRFMYTRKTDFENKG